MNQFLGEQGTHLIVLRGNMGDPLHGFELLNDRLCILDPGQQGTVGLGEKAFDVCLAEIEVRLAR